MKKLLYLFILFGLFLLSSVYGQIPGTPNASGVVQPGPPWVTGVSQGDGELKAQFTYNAASIDSADLGLINVLNYGADGVGFDAAEIQLACDAAYANGGTVYAPPGMTFNLDTSIFLRSNAIMTGATFQTTDSTFPAIIWADSAATILNHTVYLPNILFNGHVSGYWADETEHIGLKVINGVNTTFHVPSIKYFGKGILVTSYGVHGSAYNQFYITGGLASNKGGITLDPLDDDGWTNSNRFYNGRIYFFTADGTDVSGTYHIKVDSADNNCNDNRFRDISTEGNTQYYVVMCGGQGNSFTGLRWESTHPRVYLYKSGALSPIDNEFSGFSDEAIEYFQDDNTVAYNGKYWKGSSLHLRTSDAQGGFVGHNSNSGNSGVFHALAETDSIDADISAVFGWRAGERMMEGKRNTDAFPRYRFENRNGKLLLGDGTSEEALDAVISRASAGTIQIDTSLVVTGIITQTLISAALTDGAPTDAELDSATGTTPAGAGAGAIYMILDSDGSALLYRVASDGTNWQYEALTIAS